MNRVNEIRCFIDSSNDENLTQFEASTMNQCYTLSPIHPRVP